METFWSALNGPVADKNSGMCKAQDISYLHDSSSADEDHEFSGSEEEVERYHSINKYFFPERLRGNKQLKLMTEMEKLKVVHVLKNYYNPWVQKLSKESQDSTKDINRLYRKITVGINSHFPKPKVTQSDSGLLSMPYGYRFERICCKYTRRSLPPVIYYDVDIKPPLVQLHEELVQVVKKKWPQLKPKFRRKPITYVYATKEHLPVLNMLINLYFTDGVDLSYIIDNCEFTCVACYGKIVVGFGCISPGNHLKEGYVDFLLVRDQWRNCGIASFILYHLIQSCQNWNLTVHVSLSNPAMMLYQDFGFRHVRLVKNFYDYCVPIKKNDNVHAIELKLSRQDVGQINGDISDDDSSLE